MANNGKINVEAPRVPGAATTVRGSFDSMSEAKAYAREAFGHRSDLRSQDVAIRWADSGKRICYAGPCR